MSAALSGNRITAQQTWRLAPHASSALETLREALLAAAVDERLHDPLSALLVQRNVSDPELARRFLDPRDRTLHDPELLPDAAGLISRLRAAGAAGEPILVVGDFDADGLTGAAIMIRALRAIGAAAKGYIPHRDRDGHGIPAGALRAAQGAGVELLLAVDCGTGDRERVAEALEVGILVGIIDHHAVPLDPAKAAWLVNPNRADASYPFPSLAGSGLAFKIAQGLLEDHPDRRALLGELSVLAMIGGVADMVPVADEFRVIVRSALKVLNGAGRVPLGITALLTSAAAEGPYRVDVVGYTLAPRINAAGRIGDARPALDLLTTDDAAEAAQLAAQLEALNRERRHLSRSALEEARLLLGLDGTVSINVTAARLEPALVAVRGDWSPGVLGLVAGRLAEELGRPALVASGSEAIDGTAAVRCSIRSPRGFSVARALSAASTLLTRHGGHDGAGGCAMPMSAWEPAMTELALQFAAQGRQTAPFLSVDLEPKAGARSLSILAALAAYLAPTGVGNPDPLFLFRSVNLQTVHLVGDGRHARLTLDIDGSRIDAIAFGRADTAGYEGENIDLVARIVQRTYRGALQTELHVVDLQSTEGAA